MTAVRVPADAGRGLGQLVVAVFEIVRELLERQALRRIDTGTLTPEEIERLGQALLALETQLGEIREALGVDEAAPTPLPAGLADLLGEPAR